jgi:hypothetical protein
MFPKIVARGLQIVCTTAQAIQLFLPGGTPIGKTGAAAREITLSPESGTLYVVKTPPGALPSPTKPDTLETLSLETLSRMKLWRGPVIMPRG